MPVKKESMHRKLLLLISILFVAGCAPGVTQVPPTLAPTSTSVLPTGVVRVTHTPDAQAAAQNFLQAWKDERYADMYALLTRLSQDSISSQDFEKKYRQVAVNMTLKTLDFQVLSSLVTNTSTAQLAYRVIFHMTLMADIQRDIEMQMSLEAGEWKVRWDEGLILPELRGGNLLALEYKIPARGNIYDRNGHAIVAQADAVALGVIPGQIVPSQENDLLNLLSDLTGFNKTYIKSLYKNAGADWYVPVGESSTAEVEAAYSSLSNYGGAVVTPFRSRYYYDGGIASQTIGYVLPVPKERLEEYQRNGYRGDEKVGADGLEAWGEPYLAGKPEVSLYVKDGNGQIITRLAHADAVPAQSIYTTLDKDLQIQIQKSLGDQIGVAVVMERNTGRVLAMVSNPSFDPNLFEPANSNSIQLNQVLNDPDHPLYNRAALGLYPLGSVFKIITMSAALESGLYTANTKYTCGSSFTELAGITLYDWTYDHKLPPSGILTLPEGLMRSCNPFFWHIGLDLFRKNRPTDVSKMARAFGLGSETGIKELPEQAGSIIDPETDGDAVQLAIGQGSMLVTPLQVADFVAAVGNGGTLYEPQLVEKIAPPDGNPSYTFSPVERGSLPVSQDNLKIVQDAMRSVVMNKRGTANWILGPMKIPVAGKTGTAQNSNADPHGWFAGYTMANNPDKPDIAVVVLIENGGEGSDVAAPLFRRIVSLYFSGGTTWDVLMPWEGSAYVVSTPTPLVTDTPENAPTETPQP